MGPFRSVHEELVKDLKATIFSAKEFGTSICSPWVATWLSSRHMLGTVDRELVSSLHAGVAQEARLGEESSLAVVTVAETGPSVF